MIAYELARWVGLGLQKTLTITPGAEDESASGVTNQTSADQQQLITPTDMTPGKTATSSTGRTIHLYAPPPTSTSTSITPPPNTPPQGASGGGTIKTTSNGVAQFTTSSMSPGFTQQDIGQQLQITGSLNHQNDGTFPITAMSDAHTILYTNPSAVNESGTALVWTVVPPPAPDPTAALLAQLPPDQQACYNNLYSIGLQIEYAQRDMQVAIDAAQDRAQHNPTSFIAGLVGLFTDLASMNSATGTKASGLAQGILTKIQGQDADLAAATLNYQTAMASVGQQLQAMGLDPSTDADTVSQDAYNVLMQVQPNPCSTAASSSLSNPWTWVWVLAGVAAVGLTTAVVLRRRKSVPARTVVPSL